MKPIILGALLLASTSAIAQGATPPDLTGWSDFLSGLWHVIVGYLTAPLVIQFLMSQARAMFPMLGNLGVFTVVGDFIAGNWGHAKNK